MGFDGLLLDFEIFSRGFFRAAQASGSLTHFSDRAALQSFSFWPPGRAGSVPFTERLAKGVHFLVPKTLGRGKAVDRSSKSFGAGILSVLS